MEEFNPTSTPRRPTHPLFHARRHKPRRWPLVLRFYKGAIHNIILLPVVLHSLFTVLIVYLDRHVTGSLGLPASIVPSLSIVVGLMLVFRNGTSYDRFWTGRNLLTGVGTGVRCLVRSFLVNARGKGGKEGIDGLSVEEKRDTEMVCRVLIAILYAIKHNMRAEYHIPPGSDYRDGNGEADDFPPHKSEYSALLPDGLVGFEDQGLSLPLQLAVVVESYIRRGLDRGWWAAPQAAGLSAQVNGLVDAYGKMETIRSTPIPVAHLIHQKQVLALFNMVLPFATVDDFGWYAVPIVALVTFTLYGIEGIGSQLEDPFGYDKNDIKMDGIIEDTRQEIMVLLDEWRGSGEGGGSRGGMFV